jgi:hypothetical protein
MSATGTILLRVTDAAERDAREACDQDARVWKTTKNTSEAAPQTDEWSGV